MLSRMVPALNLLDVIRKGVIRLNDKTVLTKSFLFYFSFNGDCSLPQLTPKPVAEIINNQVPKEKRISKNVEKT